MDVMRTVLDRLRSRHALKEFEEFVVIKCRGHGKGTNATELSSLRY